MNGEHTRLVLSHFKWMFGNIMTVKYQQLANILSLYFSLIYNGKNPSPESCVACWLFGNLTFNLTNMVDRLATAKDKSNKKPITQSNHFHLVAEEIPRFHDHCNIPLLRLLEEAGEAYQKVSKESGLKRSNRKTDQVDTMYREEHMRELAVLDYGMRGRDPKKGSKSSSLFVESVVPNLIISCCIYNLDPVSRTTFLKLMQRLMHQQYALPLLFFYLPPGYKSRAQPLPARVDRECQCRCYCKCHGCGKDCICKCPTGCPYCAREAECRCRSEPMLVALTGQGPRGRNEQLLLQ